MLHEFNKLSLKTQNKAKLRVAAGGLEQSMFQSIRNLVAARANVSWHALKGKVGILKI